MTSRHALPGTAIFHIPLNQDSGNCSHPASYFLFHLLSVLSQVSYPPGSAFRRILQMRRRLPCPWRLWRPVAAHWPVAATGLMSRCGLVPFDNRECNQRPPLSPGAIVPTAPGRFLRGRFGQVVWGTRPFRRRQRREALGTLSTPSALRLLTRKGQTVAALCR